MTLADVATVAQAVVLTLGMTILILGLVKLAYVPLAIVFEAGELRRRRRGGTGVLSAGPLVSIIVPAYNEANVITNCVRSILATGYGRIEVFLVDDGSADGTADLMTVAAGGDGRVAVLRQPNAGKGAALNRGIAASSGEVVMCVDADGIFEKDTVERMLEGFVDDRVGAVCGDDHPVNLDRVQTRLLAVISHVGTGLVRRALTVLGCLPIVSGNIGAFRRSVLVAAGGFREDTVGEDLELTWRVHRAGYRVRFQPQALVLAESPSTVRGLWKQRVRWARGLIQTTRAQRTMVGNVRRYGAFGGFLAFNTLTMLVVPVLQLIVLLLLPVTYAIGAGPVSPSVLGILAWLGLLVSLVLVVLSIALNRAWRDLLYLWTTILWPIYSVFVGLTVVVALVLEARGHPAPWNKLERTGVTSGRAAATS